MAVVALGLATALYAYLAGTVQTDIKTALSFASLAQVGIIVAEIGLGHWVPFLWYVALVHLLGHACLRTLQFLRAPTLLQDYRHLENALGARLTTGRRCWVRLAPPRLRGVAVPVRPRARLPGRAPRPITWSARSSRCSGWFDAAERRWTARLNGTARRRARPGRGARPRAPRPDGTRRRGRATRMNLFAPSVAGTVGPGPARRGGVRRAASATRTRRTGGASASPGRRSPARCWRRLAFTLGLPPAWGLLPREAGVPFAVDGLSAPLLPLVALLHFLTALATARTKMARFSFAWMLAGEAVRLATFACVNPWLLVGLLAVATVPPLFELTNRQRPTRVYVVHMGPFVALLVAGWAVATSLPDWRGVSGAAARRGAGPQRDGAGPPVGGRPVRERVVRQLRCCS